MRKNAPSQNGFDEAVRYFRTAKELLARCSVEDDLYADVKPVREAFGTAWLAVDTAMKAALSERGLSEKQIPRSWESLRAAAARHLAVHDGKLMKLLNGAYKMVHLEGYYYGGYLTPVTARGALVVAHRLLEMLSGRKIG